MSERGDPDERGAVDRGLRSAVGRESTTFGFSIMVTVTFGAVQHAVGSADTADLLLFAVGAVLSFTLLEAALSRGFREPMPQHDSRVVAVGTSMNVISVVGAIAAALLTAELLDGDVAWPLAPFVAGIVYLILEGLEVVAAERLLRRAGHDPRPEEVEG